MKALLNVAFIFPLIITILWIRPLGRDLLAKPFAGVEQPL